MATTLRGKNLDAASKAMLFEGLNLSQLGIAFRMDHRVLVEKLHGVEPTGVRAGVPIYSISDVAPHLVRPKYDIEAYVKRMNHKDLPKEVTKEFWAGLKSRQEYLKEAGELWPTSKVIEKVGELFKLFKMTAQLATDNIERNTEMTDRQRSGINTILTGMLEDMQRAIAENFKETEDGKAAREERDNEF